VVRRFAFAVPGDLATPTGGYAYDRRLIAELRELGWEVDIVDLGEGFPFPDAATRTAANERLLAIPSGQTIVIDGLALGVLPEVAAQLANHGPVVALVHHPLALEWGLSATQAEALRASERAALAHISGVIVTSNATARLVAADYGVPAERITVAPPGNDPVPQSQGSSDGIVRLLAVGAVVPRKGFDVLVAALATLADLPWQLVIAGDLTRDRNTASALRTEIARSMLEDRVTLLGAVSPQRLASLYAAADAFVLASRFEGYGMAYAEAVSRGLPVIGTNAGAIPDTVPPDAGLLVPPGDAVALTDALRRLLTEPDLRRRLAVAARAAAPSLPAWGRSTEIFAGALERLG
jgi:glycosyltransferase involved in cell wall biosynthesis